MPVLSQTLLIKKDLDKKIYNSPERDIVHQNKMAACTDLTSHVTH